MIHLFNLSGITEDNFEAVKASLTMSEEEKSFRTAARNLFTILTPFGQEFVTTSQLKMRLKDSTNESMLTFVVSLDAEGLKMKLH